MAWDDERAGAVIKNLMRHADIRPTFNEYGNGLPAPIREANTKSCEWFYAEQSYSCRDFSQFGTVVTIFADSLIQKEEVGVGSGGRTHDIQSHSLAFCH